MLTLLLALACGPKPPPPVAAEPVTAAAEDQDPIAALRDRIDLGIALLEAGDNDAFVRGFADPEDLEEALEDEPIEDLIAEFSDGRDEQLLEVLIEARGLDPVLEDDGSVAVFSPESGRRARFHRHDDGTWYLMNH